MITRWQYYLSAAMITRWHYCISVEIVIGWIHWIVNVSNSKLQRTLDCKKKTSTSPNRMERPLIRKTGWGTTERERDIWTERERKCGCSAIYIYNSVLTCRQHIIYSSANVPPNATKIAVKKVSDVDVCMFGPEL